MGTIRIQIQRTDNGVTAHVVADHASTADTLSQGGDDLKRQLANAGVTLLSLNIETRGGGGNSESQNADSGSESRPNPMPTQTRSTPSVTTAQSNRALPRCPAARW